MDNNNLHCRSTNKMINNPHGGDISSIAKKLKLQSWPKVKSDFSVNINPLGPPVALRRILSAGHTLATVYPEISAGTASAALADAHNVPTDHIMVGNGSTDLFALLLQTVKPKSVALIAPCYAGYEEVCKSLDIPVNWQYTLTESENFIISEEVLSSITDELIFLGTPNNPTGSHIEPEILLNAAINNPDCTIVADESFIDFCSKVKEQTLIRPNIPSNLIVIKSLTKFFAIPGLRLGMLYAQPEVVSQIASHALPWSVNTFAQKIAVHLFQDKSYIEKTQTQVLALRQKMQKKLNAIDGVKAFDSDANFLLVKLSKNLTAAELQKLLLQYGILIRNCDNYRGLGTQYCRLAVRPEHEIEKLITAITSALTGTETIGRKKKPHTPAIMIVGTTSDSGKSVVAAGFCRLMARKNLKVAPFKAQNMALNSYVTAEGGEMGRAQVTQASAAGIRPHTDMNPVLLKPLGENGSQVIVNGKPIGNFNAREYYAMKTEMRRNAHKAYDRLASNNDIIILEGAGSPAEINLLAEDFVNMDMAAYANAKTVLIADIDRGGVFATILGTIELMPQQHRHLIAGIIINKFRGDVSLLDSGIRDIEVMTGVPVLGVLPYLKDLKIEEEDSMGLAQPRGNQDALLDDALLDIVVIKLPRISNYTDFLAIENDDGVRVRYVETVVDFGTPNLIIIPGTKNTRSDLKWLYTTGMNDILHKAKEKKIPIIGICGGFQMLGSIVIDNHGVEGSPGETKGLGLLDVKTTLSMEKELSQVSGVVNDGIPYISANTRFHGYEIHAGTTTTDKQPPLTITKRSNVSTKENAGAISKDGMVFGCYVHGFFDSNEIRQELWDWLCQQNGIEKKLITVNKDVQSAEFDRLADMLKKHINLTELINYSGFHE